MNDYEYKYWIYSYLQYGWFQLVMAFSTADNNLFVMEICDGILLQLGSVILILSAVILPWQNSKFLASDEIWMFMNYL
jgi:hypothetical protein